VGDHSSGDLFIAFATGNVATAEETDEHGDAGHGTGGPEQTGGPITSRVTMLADQNMTFLYDAVVDATEEAIVNALVAATTMTGRDGITAYALPHDRLVEVLRTYGRA